MTPRPVRFGLLHDFRNPEPWREPFERLYASVFDHLVSAESVGWDSVWLTEHHFLDDGYCPSPLVIAAALAGRTTRLQLGTNIAVLPLADPIKLAEDAAVVSILSGGRFDLGVGLGYRTEEFAGFRRDRSQRVGLLEEGVEILRRAWSGEPFSFEGRHYRIPEIRVTPVPERVPRLLIGGMTQPAIERAVRIGDGYACGSLMHLDIYRSIREKLGQDPATGDVRLLTFAILAEDPEQAWSRVGIHALHQMNSYLDWGGLGPPDALPRFTSPDQLLESGLYALWDGDAAVRELGQLLTSWPEVTDIHFWGKFPGEPIESANERVEYAGRHVLPKLRSEVVV